MDPLLRPAMTIGWFRDGSRISEGLVHEGRVVIPGAAVPDSGLYTCKVVTELGEFS